MLEHGLVLDLHGNIPTSIGITNGKVQDVNILDEIVPEAGAFYVMDRGYVDFKRLCEFTLSPAFFVVRTNLEKTPILQALQALDSDNDLPDTGNRLILFSF